LRYLLSVVVMAVHAAILGAEADPLAGVEVDVDSDHGRAFRGPVVGEDARTMRAGDAGSVFVDGIADSRAPSCASSREKSSIAWFSAGATLPTRAWSSRRSPKAVRTRSRRWTRCARRTRSNSAARVWAIDHA
jgi:hypothetical protein